jgi:hypothetical protein
VTIYELLALCRPIDADSEAKLSDAELIDRIRYQKPADVRRGNAAIPRDLATLVAKCLEKAPEHRYASAAALADDLQRFLDGAPLAVRPIRWPTRLARKARRHPRVAGALVGSAAIVLVAVGFFADQQRMRAATADALRRTAAGNVDVARAALQDTRLPSRSGVALRGSRRCAIQPWSTRVCPASRRCS